jgi:polar amino acid transport system substrate-binding protein
MLFMALLAFTASIAEARGPADIAADGRLGVCLQEDSPPFSDRAGNRGILLDIGDLLARKLGVKLDVTWVFSAEYIRKTSCDVVPAVGALASDDHLKLTRPYYEVRTVVVTHGNARHALTMQELKRGPVGVLADSYARHVLVGAGFNLAVRFLSNEEVLAAIQAGDVRAGFVTRASLDWYKKQHPEASLRADPNPRGEEFDYAVAVGLRGADTALQQRIDGIIGDALADGTIRSIFEKYGVTYEPPKQP